MYKWITISSPADYTQLATMLSAEYDSGKVAQRLRAGLTSGVAGILIEFEYVDKDYRSTYYNYYAKKGRRYRPDCVRLHLFDRTVSAGPDAGSLSCADERLSDHYYGYLVLRPTLQSTVGRSLLSPDIRQGAAGLVMRSKHTVHVLGYRLEVHGFPSMDQHVDIAVCAHVSCWAILRYYSQRFPRHAEVLLQEVVKMAHAFDPGGLVPSNGLIMAEAERVFQAAGTYPLVITRGEWGSFYRQLLAYLESGFPLFTGMNDIGHAVVVIGHSVKNPPKRQHATDPASHAWQLVSHFTVVDDNQLPYICIEGPSANESVAVAPVGAKYTADSFDQFIVALPEKIYYSAKAVEELVPTVAADLLGFGPGEHIFRYFVTTLSRFRQEIRENASQYKESFIQAIMDLPAAQFIWVVEFSTDEEWESGKISARVVIDATAGESDPNPVWLAHTAKTAIVFDRSDITHEEAELDVGTTHGAPLTRMDLNLRPIVRIP
ncbi:MAG TPA: hypothetical protein VN663_12175 [Ramlibacter sp.]|nr:hypothetical protein [Ramlibacter sp.]